MNEMEERVRALELSYAKIESEIRLIGKDIKDIKEIIKGFAKISEGHVKFDMMFKSFEDEKRRMQADMEKIEKEMKAKVEKLERDIQWLKKVAYGALALGTVGMPLGIEIFKHFVGL